MTLDDAIAISTENNRICPKPLIWAAIYRRLTKAPHTLEELLSPLILDGWHYSSDEDKLNRFRLHLEFADRHGLLDVVERRMKDMTEDDWHHR